MRRASLFSPQTLPHGCQLMRSAKFFSDRAACLLSPLISNSSMLFHTSAPVTAPKRTQKSKKKGETKATNSIHVEVTNIIREGESSIPTGDSRPAVHSSGGLFPPCDWGSAQHGIGERVLDPDSIAAGCPEIAPWVLPGEYVSQKMYPPNRHAPSATDVPARTVPPLVDPIMRILLSRGYLTPSKRQQKRQASGGASLDADVDGAPFNVPLPLSKDQVELHRDLLPLYTADNAFRDGEANLVLETPISTIAAALQDVFEAIDVRRDVTVLLFAMYQTPNPASFRRLFEEVVLGGSHLHGGEGCPVVFPIVVGGDVEPLPTMCGADTPPLVSFPGVRMYTFINVLQELLSTANKRAASGGEGTIRIVVLSDAFTVVRTAIKHTVEMERLFGALDEPSPASGAAVPKVVIEHLPILVFTGSTFGMPYTVHKSRKAAAADGDGPAKWANPAVMEGLVARGMSSYHLRHLGVYLRTLMHGNPPPHK